MPTYNVFSKADTVRTVPVNTYEAPAPVEWNPFPFAAFDHVEAPAVVPAAEVVVAEEWFIGVGPFWDRFGGYKIPILASADAIVQAIIKDSSVRKYLDLKGRRSDLLLAVNTLKAKGFPLNEAAILDTKPASHEVYRG